MSHDVFLRRTRPVSKEEAAATFDWLQPSVHPWFTDLRAYAQTLEDHNLVPHLRIVEYMLRYYSELGQFQPNQHYLQELATKIRELGGRCWDCFEMYKKCQEYARAKQS